jgi:diguanylate cyclase (GGDEF)-like protein/PAS domain S-box-containing protein
MQLTTNSNSLHTNSRQNETATHRQNIYIIFVDFSVSDTSEIISLLRSKQFAPRGRNVDSLETLFETLSERVWDIIICKELFSSFDPLTMIKKLNTSEKDLPVIMLSEQATEETTTQALLNHVQALLPSNNAELLHIHITREYAHLEARRQVRLMQLQLSEYQKRSKLLMDCSLMAICFISNQRIIYLNDAFCRLFGYQVIDQLLNKPLSSLVAIQERKGLAKLVSDFLDSNQNKQTYQLLGKRADDSNFTIHLALQHAYYQDNACLEITIEDNSAATLQSKFDDLDPITGLYNERYFSTTLESNVRQAQRGGNDCQLLYIDILNLDATKKQYGTEASKMLARDITDILNEVFNKSHIKARIDDTRFTVIYSDPDIDKAIIITNTLYQRFTKHKLTLGDEEIGIECAIAIVPISETTAGVSQILDRGREVILQCLASEDDSIGVFNIEHSHKQQEQTQSIQQAIDAIDNDRLRLLFQPLVPLVFHSDQHHYEVLLRMIGDDDENIPPAQFFQSMEFANLNEKMDRWVVKNSAAQLREQLDKEKKVKFFISVTDTVWEQQDLLVWIADLLRESRIPADHIVIQISETESVNSLPRAKYFVDGLRKLNCLICLKHYGSTNSSQDVLKTLDPHYIKFDASYIQEISEDTGYDSNFEELLINLTNLGKITIAPQVETPKIMSLLWKHGVGMVQGYYLQAPDEYMCYDFDGN